MSYERKSLLGLISSDETKSMAMSYSPLSIKCEDNSVEQVLEFRYLGNTVEQTGSSEKGCSLGLDKPCRVQSGIGQAL